MAARPVLALALGAGSAAGFAPLDLWPLALAAFAGFILLLERERSLRGALFTGWLFGLGHMVAGLTWIAKAFQFQAAMPAWLGWIAVVLLSLYLAVYPALAAGLAWRLASSLPARILALAAAWVLGEWLRGWVFTGFPWNPLGVLWLPVPWVSSAAAHIGALGLGAVAVLAAGAIALAARAVTGRSPSGRGLGAAVLMSMPVLLAAAAGLAHLSSPPVRNDTGAPTDRPVPLHLVQPNISQAEKWNPEAAERHLLLQLRLTEQALSRSDRPAMVLWPEAAVDYDVDRDAALRRMIGRVLRPGDMVLLGGLRILEDERGRPYAATNTIYALDRSGTIRASYEKAHLVPFGEYLPMRGLLEPLGLARLAPGAFDILPGPGPRTLSLPGLPDLGALVCYEVIFSGHVVERGTRPAWLLNASNDAWFGPSGPPQHLAQTRLRAIEEGLPVARATTSGISALIDPFGRVLASLGTGRAGVVSGNLPAPLEATLFARVGNLAPAVLALALALAALALDRRVLADRRKAG
jgi:apolipoprotein N-acyltransferase